MMKRIRGKSLAQGQPKKKKKYAGHSNMNSDAHLYIVLMFHVCIDCLLKHALLPIIISIYFIFLKKWIFILTLLSLALMFILLLGVTFGFSKEHFFFPHYANI